MAALSARIQSAVTMLVVSNYGGRHDCEITRMAADVLCGQLRNQIEGRLPTAQDFRQTNELGAAIAESGWAALHDTEEEEILMPY